LKPNLQSEFPLWSTENLPSRGLFLSTTVFPCKELKDQIPLSGNDELFILDDEVIAVRTDISKAREIITQTKPDKNWQIPITEVTLTEFKSLWDIIEYNEQAIIQHFTYSGIRGEIADSVKLINKNKIFIGANSVVEDFALIDARRGPVYISEGSEIKSHSLIQGPSFLGPGTFIKPYSHIGSGCSFGPICKLGGEISHSIVLGYSNKQHYGFLGNSYLGSWINLGAGTTTSNLKNNYSSVKITQPHRQIDSNLQFLGLMAGDHVKSAIGTIFNTGTVAGFGANIFTSGLTDKYIKPFQWGNNQKYDIEKFLNTAEIILSRRDKILTPEYKNLIYYLYDQI
jgi:UDP-N-acetylglucosamine diphosphorylase / glucose-1-phosphate thymidylyltransferase / UDP-N-acetylgalactosamine diphosphorylase / glucosamine-1-phosphate N-acetyltransferase / galactosamine-1-phosphate N-acetyltransferase